MGDGCIQRTRQKTAGVTVYLMEELGDARMRCDQLVRYVDEAIKLVEASPQKEAVFETAGHLVRSIPETTFKLQKALQAVALAATRLDYEELKQELRPEKVEQLEKVLQDVRIRQVKRRSQPWAPEEAAKMRSFAAQVRLLDEELSKMENVTMSQDSALEWKVGHNVQAEDWTGHFSQTTQLASPDEVRENFKKENPELSDEDLDKFVSQWLKNKDVVKDKNASDDDKMSRHEEGKPVDPTKDMSPEDAAEWKKNTEEHKDDFKAASDLSWKVAAERPSADRLLGSVESIEKACKDLKHHLDKGEKTPWDDVERLLNSIRSTSATMLRRMGKTASDDEDKQSKFEEGKPADPTENMSPEDAATWKTEHEKNKDRFKAAAEPRGKAQTAIMEYLGTHDKAELTDLTRSSSLRGVHVKDVMSAAEALKKGGHINYDGKTLSKKASDDAETWKVAAALTGKPLATHLNKTANELFALSVDVHKAMDGARAYLDDSMGLQEISGAYSNKHLHDIWQSFYSTGNDMKMAARNAEYLSLVLQGKKKLVGT